MQEKEQDIEARVAEIQQQIVDFRQQKQAEVEAVQNEIAKLREKLSGKQKPPIPPEIQALRAQLDEFNEKVGGQAQMAIYIVKEKQCKLNEQKLQEEQQKQKKGRAQYTSRYLTTLRYERQRLQEEFLEQQKQFIELQQQITDATTEEQALKKQLLYRELSESSSSDVFDHEKMVENLQQVEQQYNTESRLNSRSTMRTKTTICSCRTNHSFMSAQGVQQPINYHAMCKTRLQIIKNRTNVLRESIASLKHEFQPIIQQITYSLRESGYLDNFLSNGELALSEGDKEELAANLAQNESFIGNLVRICCGGGVKGVTKSQKVGNYV